MEASEDFFDYDVASARAVVRGRKAGTPKLASTFGEHSSNSKHKVAASISSSTADRLQQMAVAIVAGEGNSISDRGHNAETQSDDAAGGVACDTCQRRTRSMSCSRSQTPPTEEGDSAANAAHHVPQPIGALTRTEGLRTSKRQPQKSHFHATQPRQQQLVEPLQDQLHHQEDQAGTRLGQLAVAARASSPTAVDSNHSAAGQPHTGAGGSTLLGLQAEQPGTFTNEDCQRTSEVDGAQQHVGTAAAELPFKQRKTAARGLPPTASAGTDRVSAPVGQQPQQVSGSRLSAEEHRVSLDEPFQTIGWPAPVSVLQQQAVFPLVEQQQQQEQPVAVTWPEPAVQDASEPAAGLRTRLSMRSVAYLEDLLEQTAQAASSGKADGGKQTQPLSTVGVRAAAAQIGAAISGRLSVGNLIISPPMSRSASMHPAAGGSSASKVASAADAVQAAFRRVKSPSAAVEVQPGAAGVQALLQLGLSRLPGHFNSQHLLQRAAASATPAAAHASSAAHDSDGTTSSSVDDSGIDQAPDVWTAAAGAGGAPASAGAAAKLQKQKRVSYSSHTCSSPGSESPVCNQGRIGAFATAGAPPGMHPGGLHAGPLQSFGSGFHGQAGSAAGVFQAPRKSDRQLGLETVQRIDAIFRQQSRSLQGLSQAATTANNSSTLVASEAVAAGQQHHVAAADGSNTPVAASAAADQRELVHDERCTVAALCRGLRFDGDITLKEVAMAFQLRDAYDWDEDLEAASKAKAIEDPRLKGPRLLSCSPSLSNSSVCPDPEPVSGFFPRSTWMAGNGGASPLASLGGVRPAHSGQEYHPGAAGLAPALVQRLHMQSSNGIVSQPGSVSSSRRASLANSPINLPGHDGPHQQTGQLAPAALHAAVSQQLQQQGARGWAALMPGMESDPGMQSYPYMPTRGAGRGRGRKRKNADDSDDDYDPRKPSHQQEVYQRKHIDRRAQQQYHQQRICSRMSRYGYSYQAMQQAYSAAAMQQAYMMQVVSKSGPGLSMQQVQHLQQLQYMQQQAQMAMAAMDEQAAAAAAGGNGYEELDGAPGAMPGAAGCVQPPNAHSAMQSPINSAAYVKQEQSQQRQPGVQQLQAANRGQESAMQLLQHNQQQHQERPQHVQPSPQQQQQAGIRPQQTVRRPSYVKRRLTADDAADWLQNNAPGGLLFHRQPGPPRLDLGDTYGRMGYEDDHDMGLQILSPTAVRPPPGLDPHSQHTNGFGGSFSRPGGRLRRRTLAGLEYDIIHGHIHIGDGSTDDDEMDSDVSDPDAAYGLGGTGGRRGGRASRGGRCIRGGRGRGRGRSSSLALSPADSPQRAAAPNDTTASPGGSCGSPGVHSGTRGRGRRAGARGRSSAGRGRSCLSSVALASQMDAVAVAGPAGAADGQQQQVSNGVQPPSEAAGAAANGAAGSEAARARGRGRGRGRGRASNGSAAATAGWGEGSAGLDGSTGGRRSRGAGARGRGRVGRPPLSSYAAAPRVIAAAFPGQQHADLAGDAAAYVSTTNGLSGQKRQKLDRVNSGVGSATAAGAQPPGSEPAAAPAKQGLASMPSWFPAGLAPQPKPAGTDRAGTVPRPHCAQQIPQINHLAQKSLGPSRSLQLARASPALIEHEGQQQEGAAVLLAAGPDGGQSHQDHPLQQKAASWCLGANSSDGAGAQYAQNGEFRVEEPAQDLSDGVNDVMMTDLACHESLLWSLVLTGED